MTQVIKKMQRIKGNKSIKQMTKQQRREYARLREQVRTANGTKPSKKPTLWSVSKASDGTVVFKNKDVKLYGISPKEYQALSKKSFKSVSKKNAKRVAR